METLEEFGLRRGDYRIADAIRRFPEESYEEIAERLDIGSNHVAKRATDIFRMTECCCRKSFAVRFGIKE